MRRQNSVLSMTVSTVSSFTAKVRQAPVLRTATNVRALRLHRAQLSADLKAAFVAMRARPNMVAASISIAIVSSCVFVRAVQTSWLETNLVTSMIPAFAYRVEAGENKSIRFPKAGPYDTELGYASMPHFLERMARAGYEVEAQARLEPFHNTLVGMGLYPAYQEKSVHGLVIKGTDDSILSAEEFPKKRYGKFEDMPELVVGSLLFIEDRQLLDPDRPASLNPAIAWDRLSKASLELVLDKLGSDRNVPGGSTLATQIEKFRHSDDGRTRSVSDKLRQMASATVRSYLQGHDTTTAREQIVLNYVNEVPLGAVAGVGEIKGLGEAVQAWYGIDFKQLNVTLNTKPASSDVNGRAAKALAFKRVLSLFLSQRRPAFYLLNDHAALEVLADSYVRVMERTGTIPSELANDALAAKLNMMPVRAERRKEVADSFINRKAVNALRVELKSLLGLGTMYELDRLDAEVTSTFDGTLQTQVSQALTDLRTKEGATAAGVVGERMLKPEQAALVNYSFTLLERLDDRNVVRVQTDSVNSPLDLNRGGKLELGSTAKLRTLLTYLEMTAEIFHRFEDQIGDKDRLKTSLAGVGIEDDMTRWVLDYLRITPAPTLESTLDAAVNRTYSAAPWQGFRTGGGVIRFANFDASENGYHMSVAQAFQKSNNLVFVRIMRDVVQHVISTRINGAAAMLADVNHPLRKVYIEKFVDFESTAFLRRYYRQLVPLNSAQRLQAMLGTNPAKPASPAKMAAVILTLRPDLDLVALRMMLTQAHPKLEDAVVLRYWNTMRPGIMPLHDRAYVARLHPLELWLGWYLETHTDATFATILKESKFARTDAYTWLLKKSSVSRQERDIRTMLEREAFSQHIVQYWKRQGFPFDTMTPSYASALGSSGDRPSALADLMGAINNNGAMMPTVRIEQLRFGGETPYETTVAPGWRGATRVVSPEVAAVTRKALISVVEGGSARRLFGAMKRSDGTEIAISAKTGTGDNRLDTYGAGGRLLRSELKSRTATLVFAIGDRFYGTITAYVTANEDGSDAGNKDFSFTSSLVVQAMKALLPKMERRILEIEDPWSMAVN